MAHHHLKPNFHSHLELQEYHRQTEHHFLQEKFHLHPKSNLLEQLNSILLCLPQQHQKQEFFRLQTQFFHQRKLNHNQL